jgi:hypothetical protein
MVNENLVICNSHPESILFRLLRFSWLLVALMVAVMPVKVISRSPDLFNVSLQNVNPLQGLLRFGMENHLPLEVILSSQAGLCDSTKNISLNKPHVYYVLKVIHETIIFPNCQRIIATFIFIDKCQSYNQPRRCGDAGARPLPILKDVQGPATNELNTVKLGW